MSFLYTLSEVAHKLLNISIGHVSEGILMPNHSSGHTFVLLVSQGIEKRIVWLHWLLRVTTAGKINCKLKVTMNSHTSITACLVSYYNYGQYLMYL